MLFQDVIFINQSKSSLHDFHLTVISSTSISCVPPLGGSRTVLCAEGTGHVCDGSDDGVSHERAW